MSAPRTWQQRLLGAWQSRSAFTASLLPLAWVYGLLWWARACAYRVGWRASRRLPVPVVVVGNVIVGGAGKTPTVIGLVRHLQHRGWRPGVISRGHGRDISDCVLVTESTESRLAGDEPLLIARATGVPLVAGRDRWSAGRHLLQQHPEVDVIVSDDGMQHWALQRDVTVVVFDARGLGNGWLLPAGMLREPWPPGRLGQETMLVLQTTGTANKPQAPTPANALPGAYLASRCLGDTAYAASEDTAPMAMWAKPGRTAIGAFAGIAQPDAFFSMLRVQGLRLRHAAPLNDHSDASAMLALIAQHPDCDLWLCTEKDAVKLFPLLRGTPEATRVWAVPLQQTLPAELLQAIDGALDALSCRHGQQTA